jgi:hypothetical protein
MDRLEQRLLALEAQLQHQMQELRAVATYMPGRRPRGIAPPTHYGQDFRVWLSNGDSRLNVGQGYLFAGDLAEYDWPQETDITYLTAPAGTDEYLVFFEVKVHSSYGVFATSYTPTLNKVKTSAHHTLNVASVGRVDKLVCWAKTVDGKWAGTRAMRGLYAPVVKTASGPIAGYTCALTNHYDAGTGTEPANPDARGVEKCHAGE